MKEVWLKKAKEEGSKETELCCFQIPVIKDIFSKEKKPTVKIYYITFK